MSTEMQNTQLINGTRREYKPPELTRIKVSTAGSLYTTGAQYGDTYCTAHYHDSAAGTIDCTT
jgi:hypothetical protein